MRHPRFPWTTLCAVALSIAATPAAADEAIALQRAAGPGRVSCTASENGRPASGTLVVREGTRTVAQGACDRPLAVPAGRYTAVVSLDGTLDRAERTESIEVHTGRATLVRAAFATGRVEVRITAGGRRAAGMATIYRGNERIGTLASGVEGHLSAGTYRLVVRYRTEERSFDAVSVPSGETRTVDVSF